MLNRVTLAGRLTADPETQVTKSGVVVTNFSVAVDRDYVDQSTGKREADFIDVTAWRGLGELVTTYFHKGDFIMVDGRLTVSSRTSKEGIKYRNVKVVAANIYFGSKRNKVVEEPAGSAEIEAPSEEEPPAEALTPEVTE